jgi:LacI family transcriptional regulator
VGDYQSQPTVLVNITTDHWLLRGVLDACPATGWRPVSLAGTSNYIPSRQPPIGAIIEFVPDEATFARIQQMGIPIVSCRTHEREELKRLPAAVQDLHAAGRLAAAGFVERGFRDLAFIEFRNRSEPNPLFEGLREGAKDVGGCTVHHLFLEAERGADGNAAFVDHAGRISAWLPTLPMPLGVFAYSYRMGSRIIAACEMSGLHVPEHVAVLCRGNQLNMCESAPVPLSAIDMNPAEHGRQLIQLLKRLVDGKPAPHKPVYVPPKGIVERRSTDILAVADPRVAAAIRFMWDNLGRSIGVDDVAKHVGISRTTLERAFRKCLGRGVGTELRRKRLELSKELLRGTNMTVDEIAEAISMMSRRCLLRAFRNEYGMTPLQYRKGRA